MPPWAMILAEVRLELMLGNVPPQWTMRDIERGNI